MAADAYSALFAIITFLTAQKAECKKKVCLLSASAKMRPWMHSLPTATVFPQSKDDDINQELVGIAVDRSRKEVVVATMHAGFQLFNRGENT